MNEAVGRTAALIRKEIYSYAISPAFYGAALFFILFVNLWLFYFQRYFVMDAATLRPWFSAFPLAFVVAVPALTMKSWAEERKLGTMELLLTMPFSEWNLALGKFFASFAALLVILLLSLPLPLCILPRGEFDGGVLAADYTGLLFLGASALSLGLFLSSLFRSQAGAFLGSAGILLAAMLINRLPMSFSLPQPLADFINFVSLSFHFEAFSRGLIDSRDLAFFTLASLLFLYLNTRVLLFRKWSRG
ncbi:MAG: ABC transporter permease subunit [Treponema sp.]|jgi:ABC-2 type transport system permease protein|nr:ABC transporter permease subunit [Treponema sp.]